MRRVHGIFHRLQPVAVELRQNAQPMPTVSARPDVILGYRRRGLRPEISPVKPGELLHRIGSMFDGKRKFAVPRFRRCLQAVTLRVVEPAVIGTGKTSLLDSAVGKRSAAMRAAVLQEAHLSPL